MLMRTVDVIAVVPSNALWLTSSWISGTASAARDGAPQTLALSSQAMSALAQSSLVRGWATVSIGCAPPGTASAAKEGAPQALVSSSQAMSALAQSALVRGWAT